MPGGDRTGPMGRGSMTGWGRGNCGETQVPGYGGGGSGGRGRDFGGGGGRGRQNRFRAIGTPGSMRGEAVPPDLAGAAPTADTELQWLKRRHAVLEAEQREIKARLDQLIGEQTD